MKNFDLVVEKTQKIILQNERFKFSICFFWLLTILGVKKTVISVKRSFLLGGIQLKISFLLQWGMDNSSSQEFSGLMS